MNPENLPCNSIISIISSKMGTPTARPPDILVKISQNSVYSPVRYAQIRHLVNISTSKNNIYLPKNMHNMYLCSVKS